MNVIGTGHQKRVAHLWTKIMLLMSGVLLKQSIIVVLLLPLHKLEGRLNYLVLRQQYGS
jgi:hypothetical protein